MGVLRDIFRARGRSTLTIAGVATGVFLIVLMGAVAENSNRQLDTIETRRAGLVTVAPEGATVNAFSQQTYNWIPRLLSSDILARVREVPGVREAAPRVAVQIDPEAFWMGVPTTLVGGFSRDSLQEQASLRAGRFAKDTERGVVTLGADVARQLNAKVGDTVELRGVDFEVVGILERRSITDLDQTAFVSLDDARPVFVSTLEKMYRAQLGDTAVITSIEVTADEGVDADRLAAKIAREVDGVAAFGPEKIKSGSAGTAATYDSLALSMSVIALFAGGLSVVNTMIVSAIERTREVGIKRALGASSWRITRDVLWESAVIGLIGGVIGAAAGSVAVLVTDRALSAATGVGMFTLTPRLALAAVAFAGIVGVVGGLYPARYASKLDPVDALARP